MVNAILVGSRGIFVVRIGILTVLWVILSLMNRRWKEIQSTFFKRVDIEAQRAVDLRVVHRLAAVYASSMHLLVSALLHFEGLVCG